MNSIFKSPNRNYFIAGLFVFIVTAIFSVGYYHPDEHFQILEFANYKLGFSPASDLAWEFQAQIRPALQPFLAMGVIRALMFIHIDNPFTWALILRLMTAVFSWFVISRMSLYMTREIRDEYTKKIFLFMCFFLWFIPAISVRFSSENFGGISFLLGIYLLMNGLEASGKKKIIQFISAGLLLGFAFFFRFQMGFAIIGLGVWLLFVKRLDWFSIVILIFSGITAIFISTITDSLFYGQWTFTPLNYFVENILEARAAHWGINPWWYYFKIFIEGAIPPISIFLLLFFFIGLFTNSKHVLTWCIIPFILGHMLVGHKEIRFLFPMVFAFIFLTSQGIAYLITLNTYLTVRRVVLILFILINIPVLAITSIIPARDSVCYFRFLREYSSDQKIELLCTEKNIYETMGLEVNFYKSKNVHCIVVCDTIEMADYLNKHPSDVYYVLETDPKENIYYSGYEKVNIYSLFPHWLLSNNANDWQERTRIWKIMKLNKVR